MLGMISLLAAFGMMGVVSCGSSSSSIVSSVETTSAASSVEKVLVLSASSTKVYVGASITLTVKCGGKNVSDTLTFESSDATIATVSSTGKVEGLKAGNVTITVKATGYTSGTISLAIAPSSQDVTFVVTPAFAEGSGITEFETDKAIWIASPAFGTETNWGYKILTKSETDSTWSIVLEDCEFEQTLSYKFYYDDATTFGWRNVNTESVDNAARTYTFVEGTTSVALAATFNIATTVPSVAVTVSGFTFDDKTTLLSTTFIYIYDNITDSTRMMTRSTNDTEDDPSDDTFSVNISNVSIGEYGLKVSLCLGLENSDAAALMWNSTISDTFYAIAADTTAVAITNATFAKQPVAPTGTLTATLTGAFTNITAGTEVKIVHDDVWTAMTYADSAYTYSITGLAEGDTYSFFVYSWFDDADHKVYADTSTKWSPDAHPSDTRIERAICVKVCYY